MPRRLCPGLGVLWGALAPPESGISITGGFSLGPDAGRGRLLLVGCVHGVHGGARRGTVSPRPDLAPIVVAFTVGFVQAFPGARPWGPGQSMDRVVAIGESPAVPGRRGAGRACGPGSPGRSPGGARGRVSCGGRHIIGPGHSLLSEASTATAWAISLIVVRAPVVAVVPGTLGHMWTGCRPPGPSVATGSGGLAPGRTGRSPLHAR